MTLLDTPTTAPSRHQLLTARPLGTQPGWGAIVAGSGAAVAVVTCGPADLAVTLASVPAGGGTIVVAVDPDPAVDTVLTEVDADDPLVFRTTIDARGAGPLGGRRLRLPTAVELDGLAGAAIAVGADRPATVLAVVAGDPGEPDRPVAVELYRRGRRVVVVGSAALLADRWLPVADNAVLAAHAAGAADAPAARARVRAVRPAGAGTADAPRHPAPWVVDARGAADELTALVPAGLGPDDPAFVRAAGHAGRLLPPAVHDALVDLADAGHPSGALVVRGLPVGRVPATPASPRARTAKDHVSELVLLAAARRLGQPVGYAPEHGGELVQNLVPTASAAGAQTSTSSSVLLEFHTEAAFHPHKPRFLLLLALRADPFGEARTLLCSIDAVLPHLSLGARAVLAEPRFRTSADESYTGGRTGRLGRLVPVLAGDTQRPALTFDADLMTGADAEAADALAELRDLVRRHHIGVALGPGDLLVVDNHAAVHGRSPFRARYDGTDRWLQRTFVVADLAPSAGERHGRAVTTRFTP